MHSFKLKCTKAVHTHDKILYSFYRIKMAQSSTIDCKGMYAYGIMWLCNTIVCVCVSSKSKRWNEWVMCYGTIQYLYIALGALGVPICLLHFFLCLLLHFQRYANLVKPKMHLNRMPCKKYAYLVYLRKNFFTFFHSLFLWLSIL